MIDKATFLLPWWAGSSTDTEEGYIRISARSLDIEILGLLHNQQALTKKEILLFLGRDALTVDKRLRSLLRTKAIVSGPGTIKPPKKIKVYYVTSRGEMLIREALLFGWSTKGFMPNTDLRAKIAHNLKIEEEYEERIAYLNEVTNNNLQLCPNCFHTLKCCTESGPCPTHLNSMEHICA